MNDIFDNILETEENRARTLDEFFTKLETGYQINSIRPLIDGSKCYCYIDIQGRGIVKAEINLRRKDNKNYYRIDFMVSYRHEAKMQYCWSKINLDYFWQVLSNAAKACAEEFEQVGPQGAIATIGEVELTKKEFMTFIDKFFKTQQQI